MDEFVEKRKEQRSIISWPVSAWIPDANRFYNGKSVDMSKSGASIVLPESAPITKGMEIEVNFPRTTSLARSMGQYSRIKLAKVLRVNPVDDLGKTFVAMEFLETVTR